MEGLDKLKMQSQYDELVNELMGLFRSALTALVPVFQKTDLKWNLLEEHDEFFSLSESLFKMIVIDKLEKTADEKNLEIAEFANYGYHYKNMKGLNYISVESNQYPNANLVFNFISSKDKPFDVVYCNRIDNNGNVLDKDLPLEFEAAVFKFKFL